MTSRLTHQPCPDCGSSDALTIYEDGHTHCFSCGTTKPAAERKRVLTNKTFRAINPDHIKGLPDRRISEDTARKFGVVGYNDTNNPEAHIYPYYDGDGNHVANKIRRRSGEPRFTWEGDQPKAGLFGQQLFPAGGKILTIVEGECDAMAVYQMNESAKPGSNYAVVSVQSASSAPKDVARSMKYVDSFEQIVLVFDRDEPKFNPKEPTKPHYPGQEAARRVAALFAIGKVRVCTLEEYKDANDYLVNGKAKKFLKEWWSAPKFVPTGIKFGRDLWESVSNPPEYETIPYPFDGLNEKTYGIRLSEFVVVTAPPKIGKTTILKAIEYHILKNTESAVGLLHLEEPVADTALGLMSIEAQKPLHLPDVREKVTKEELRLYYEQIVDTERLVIWDHFGSNSIQEVLDVIRHMHAMGCKYVVLDHLSIVVSDQSGDERKQLDELATKIKMLCMELNVCVIAVIHQNRAGEIRGTAGVEQLANIVMRLTRDKMDPDSWRRSITRVDVTENRFCGRTGPACYLQYMEDKGVLSELTDAEIKIYEAGKSAEDFDDVPF
jgi:twinkle protein